MSGFDLRFVIPVVINLLKSQTKAHPWDWDAFSLLHNPNEVSWIKISFHISLLVLFSCTSITFTRRPSPNTALICFQFGNFSPHIAVSFVCSLVFPQALFWFLYPAILIFSYLILGWVNVQLSAFPVGTFQLSFSLIPQQVQANVHLDPQLNFSLCIGFRELGCGDGGEGVGSVRELALPVMGDECPSHATDFSSLLLAFFPRWSNSTMVSSVLTGVALLKVLAIVWLGIVWWADFAFAPPVVGFFLRVWYRRLLQLFLNLND
ncbi:hypothetical protein TIFTF001_003010 [Ficus carica]|uniref:Uncharacterized protein n=1 Tax=Ficus carica TaxID=3494 RepID=A0AA87ZXM5_FICCA|nr:hypothetical protein TIFTF001_003010 [Ficus carica]